MYLLFFEKENFADDQHNCFKDKHKLEKLPCNLLNIEEDEPSLVNFIKMQKIRQPAPKQLNYNLIGKPLGGQIGQVGFVLDYFENKTNGFFIEAGAHDGATLSNSLLLEKDFGWTGLLVEPNPISFKLLKKKHRKSFAINSCISTTSHPDVIDIRIRGMGSTVIKDIEGAEEFVLRSIPWDKVNIDLVSVEVNHSDQEKI